MTGPRELMSSTEAGRYLGGISANAMRILVHRGKIRAYKPNGRLMFKRSDLEAFVERALLLRSSDEFNSSIIALERKAGDDE